MEKVVYISLNFQRMETGMETETNFYKFLSQTVFELFG
jgi:hypothetical protein